MTVSERAWYEAQIIKLRANNCRMDSEYADYLDRWLHSPKSVDGLPYKYRIEHERIKPMPYNVYWIE